MRLTERVYDLTRGFPPEEKFGLTSQMRRAAVSVPSCIAEGNARASIPDYLRLLAMSAGSLAELRTQTALSHRLGFVPKDRAEACDRQITRVTELLKKLQSSLRHKINEAAAAPRPSRFPFPVSPR
jgi:four helix bundle protein